MPGVLPAAKSPEENSTAHGDVFAGVRVHGNAGRLDYWRLPDAENEAIGLYQCVETGLMTVDAAFDLIAVNDEDRPGLDANGHRKSPVLATRFACD